MKISTLDITNRMWVRLSPIEWDCECPICGYEMLYTIKTLEMKLTENQTHLKLPHIQCPQCTSLMAVMVNKYLD